MTKLFHGRDGYYVSTKHWGLVWLGTSPQLIGAYVCSEEAHKNGDPFNELGRMIHAGIAVASLFDTRPHREASNGSTGFRK